MPNLKTSGEIKIPPSTKKEIIQLNVDDVQRMLRQLVMAKPTPS